MNRLVIAVLLFSLSAFAAKARVVEISLPAHREWCKTIVVPDVNALQTVEGQQAVFRNGQEPIALCARSRGLSFIGIPFVEHTETIDGQPTAAKLMFCAAVGGAALPCDDAVASRDVESITVLAAVCPKEQARDCKSEVTAVLKAEPLNLDDAAIARIAWRFAEAADSSDTPDAIATALNGSQGQVVGRPPGFVAKAKDTAVSAVAAQAAPPTSPSFIIVAAPLPDSK